MSHKIAKIANRDSFAYAGPRKPWHGLGTQVPAQMTVEEAILAGNLDWEVQKRPIMTADTDAVLVPNVYAIGRVGPEQSANGELKFIPFENTVKGRYTIVQNSEAFEFFNSAIEDGAACIETVGALNNGSRVFAMAKLPDEFEPIPGEAMERYILLSTSHDGSANIMATFTTVRVVCWNTLNAALEGSKNIVKIRHTKSAPKRIETAHKLLEQSEQYWEKLREAYSAMVLADMGRLDVIDFIANMFPGRKKKGPNGNVVEEVSSRTQNNRDAVLNLFAGAAIGSNSKIAGTAYQAFQAVTQYIDHERSLRRNTDRWNASVFGSGATMRQKAFDYLIGYSSKI